MAWEKSITNKGVILQAKILSGTSVIITRAAVGSSYVPPEQLASLVDVSDYLPNIVIDFDPPIHNGDKAIIKTIVTNESLEIPVTYYQVGVFAEDPDEGEILYLIAQNPAGEYLPTIFDTAEFQAKYDFEVLVSPTSDITVIYDPSRYVTHSQLDEHVNNTNVHITSEWRENLEHAINDFIVHIDNDDIHVTAEQKAEWTQAALDAAQALANNQLLQGEINSLVARLTQLEDSIFAGITANPFMVTFESLSGLTVTRGIWNTSLNRIEC